MNIQFLNKQAVLDYTKLPEQVVYPLMCHGSDVLVVKSLKQAKKIKPRTLKADAIITTSKDVLLVLPTADCAPIALYDEENNILAMMHCGWKPSLRGLIENTVTKMQELGANLKNIKAVIGPCMDYRSFECQDDMRELFLEKNKNNDVFFRNKINNKWKFDLKLYCQIKLYGLGIENIEISEVDTFSNPDYHSYRKYCHLHGKGFEIGQKNGAFMNLNLASL